MVSLNRPSSEIFIISTSERKLSEDHPGYSPNTQLPSTQIQIEQIPDIVRQYSGEMPSRIGLTTEKKSPEEDAMKDENQNLENYHGTCGNPHHDQIAPQSVSTITEEGRPPTTLWRKIVIFFDLDLLRDLTYVNLLVGVTLGNFVELNFASLTPFVLDDWKFTKNEIATIMSVLGGVDVSMRFFIPFVAGKIGWENKSFYLAGIMAMAMGRVCKCDLQRMR